MNQSESHESPFAALLSSSRYRDVGIERLELRHRFIIDPNREYIAGNKVLDLACHDGRWSYAFAAAGASRVDGIEFRQHLIDEFNQNSESSELKLRINLWQGDIFVEMEKLAATGATNDVVAVLGIFYHIMDHYRLLKLARSLHPRLMIIDSEFSTAKHPMIAIRRERTEKDLNSAAHFKGQGVAPIGLPSPSALELMADTIGYDVTWLNWDEVPADQRKPVADYFGPIRGNATLRRHTAALWAR